MGSLVAIGLCAPGAQAQVESDVYAPVALCVVAGAVALNPGIVVNVPLTGTGPGSYTFTTISLVCAGIVIGTCPAASTGSTLGTSPTGGFAGSWAATCLITGQTCSGTIGGPALVQYPVGLPVARVPADDASRSLSVGPLLAAGLDEVSCSGLGGLGISDGDGLLAATAIPDPLTLNSACGTGTAGPPIVRFCGIILAGVAVLLTEPVDVDGGN
ncbi:MAG: hypothetical protein QOF60_49 [Actinomycetota bacterium]|jgi:hypothetical protein|nr:hypothetical protein [Actinomycetota bacterium]